MSIFPPTLFREKLTASSLWLAVVVGTCIPLPAYQDLSSLSFEQDIQPLLDRYCFRCHGEEKQKGDVQLSSFHDKRMLLKEHKLWREVINLVREEEMPDEEPLPSPEERKLLVDWLEHTLNEIDWSQVKNPGHITMPRLTKEEYNNTMRDLLGVDIRPGNTFSEEGEGLSGFTNDRDNLFITPVLMEKYIEAAERALDALLAYKNHPIDLHYESESMFMTETRETPKRIGEDFLGYVLNRGQMTLYESIEFPYDGIYEFTVRAVSTEGPTGTRLRINDQVKGDIEIFSEEPGLYTIRAFVPKGSQQVAWNIQVPAVKYIPRSKAAPVQYKDLPVNAGLLIKKGISENAPRYPEDPSQSGEVKASVTLLNKALQLMQEPFEALRLFGTRGNPTEILRLKEDIKKRKTAVETAMAGLARKLGLSPGAFQLRFRDLNSDRLAANEKILAAIAHVTPAVIDNVSRPQSVGIDWIQVRGPVRPTTEETEKVFIALPGKGLSADQAAERILTNFSRRAFRRAVSGEEVDRYLNLFREEFAASQSFDDAVKLALTAVLASPHFLYRPELAPSTASEAFQIDDYQLASRLSYFLWMTMPDDTLFDLAERGRLHQPRILKQQVKRMLEDPRAFEAMATFAGQWLGIENLGATIVPDPRTFAEFTPPLSRAMKDETFLTFEALIKENGSLLNLLDSRESFLNDVLAEHYGIEGVEGGEMRRVALTNPHRGGLLGMASILTATSNPGRTNPVSRGKWVLETLLGGRIPEPPADAGILPENAGRVNGRTLREEFEMHRRNPNCVDCHEKIDPIGFGLENFDAIGRYRESENGVPIDSQGTMPDGVSFTGPIELKHYLLQEKQDAFIRNITEKMLAFALGRKLRYYDEAAIVKIIDNLARDNYSASTLITEVVLSYPFHYQHPNPNHD